MSFNFFIRMEFNFYKKSTHFLIISLSLVECKSLKPKWGLKKSSSQNGTQWVSYVR